eukprot:EG_transcript_22520
MQSTGPNHQFNYALLQASLQDIDQENGDWKLLCESASSSHADEAQLIQLSQLQHLSSLTVVGDEPSTSLASEANAASSALTLPQRGYSPLSAAMVQLRTPERPVVIPPPGFSGDGGLETPCFFQPPPVLPPASPYRALPTPPDLGCYPALPWQPE